VKLQRLVQHWPTLNSRAMWYESNRVSIVSTVEEALTIVTVTSWSDQQVSAVVQEAAHFKRGYNDTNATTSNKDGDTPVIIIGTWKNTSTMLFARNSLQLCFVDLKGSVNSVTVATGVNVTITETDGRDLLDVDSSYVVSMAVSVPVSCCAVVVIDHHSSYHIAHP